MNQKDLLVISATVFLTVIAWVILELYGITKSIPTNADIESASLEYTINTDLLDELEQKSP